ncbi:MAG: hypothetical protein U9P49_11430 [Thermodesulfobacteriota bacterium]|nr:hypothetical protein [Thermodesulfobacteriota bacterium]
MLPHLTTWTHTGHNEGIYGVDLINNGIGPAFIELFELKVDGKLVKGEGAEQIEKALKIIFPHYGYKSHQSYVAKGYAMAPKEKRPIVVVQFTSTERPSPEEIEDAFNRTDLTIVYKSAYHQIFTLNTKEEKSNKQIYLAAENSS